MPLLVVCGSFVNEIHGILAALPCPKLTFTFVLL